MSSQKRIDSSRANGAKSCGPVTPEGRARSRAAALTHGLASDQLLIEGESEEKFNALREEYLAEFQPQTRSRFDLVDQLVAARWRHNRVLALQTALIDRQITRQEPEIRREYDVCDGETRAAIAYQHLIDDGSALESFNRHETRLSAELRRTLKLLDAHLENQKLHDEPSDAQPPRSEEDRDAAEAPPSTVDQPPSTSSEPGATSAAAPLENQKFHHEPSDAQPPHSDEDGPPAETPPSTTIDHPPSTTEETQPFTIDPPPSTHLDPSGIDRNKVE